MFQSEYELSPDEKRFSKAQKIYEKYLLAEVSTILCFEYYPLYLMEW